MARTQKQKSPRRQAYKPLIAAAFAVAGFFHMVGAVVAAGTPAGETISNTATATYDDGNGTSINATSNTVTIQVAEIAGLTAVPSGFEDLNGGAIEGNDQLSYNFTVTNTGNDETDVFIPGINNIITENFDVSNGTIEVFTTADGTTLGTSLGTVAPDGSNYSLLPNNINGDNLGADEQFIVVVTGNIADNRTDGTGPVVANDPIGVTLGNTPPNDNTLATQNQDFDNDGDDLADLYTINVGGVAPSNGPREASAEQNRPFASADNPLALATVLKTASVVGNNAGSAQDDQITYSLGLRVEDTAPLGTTFQPASLEGTTITDVDGANVQGILVSDAIPVGTVLESVGALPTGWSVVYSTTAAAGANPLTTPWTATAPTDLSIVTRIGFVNSGPIAAGSDISGLTFTVVTSGLPVEGGTVNNIAQVFGETVGDTNNNVVYDESGDANPNNFDGSTPPLDENGNPSPTGTFYPTGGDDGVADPTVDDVDTANNNTGNGPDGEVNQVNIVPPNDDILNGPNGAPGASGPTDSNDDFTNLSTAVPAGIAPGDTFDPTEVIFNNTLNNPATGGFLSNVTLQPLSPTEAEGADGDQTATGQYGLDTDIPDGTVVTIEAVDENGVTVTAQYAYNATNATFDFAGTTTSHVNVGDVLGGASVNYTVTVDLPTGEALDAVGIPIVAFPDDDPTLSPGYTGETTSNITIDRLYTGFMSLTKQARVLDANGTERIPFTDNFAATQNIAPGEFIEYQIEYQNISTPAGSGSGNVLLNANNFVITENGSAGTNTWGSNTNHVQSTVVTQGTVEYTDEIAPNTVSADPVDGTRVDEYENTVGTVSPGNSGSLIFRREVQ